MNTQVLERVLRSPRLPSLPAIAVQVIDLVQQDDVNIKQIAETISHDPALATKILRTVNSSFYGQRQEVSTISHALVILGLSTVKTLALGFSLVANLKESKPDGFDHMAYWRRSLHSASAARVLARNLGILQQEETFLGGLLQDLGVLAMVQTLGPEYASILHQADGDHSQLGTLERTMLQTNHAEIGGELAQHWKLPPILRHCISFHENPDAAPEEYIPVVRCVALSSRAAEVFLSPHQGLALDEYFRLAQDWFNLPRESAEPLLRKAHDNTNELRRLFDLPNGPMESPDEILSRAHEALLTISLQQQQRTEELEEKTRHLAVQAVTDSLTGVANRRRFNEYITDRYDTARRENQPLSVLFLDADHFKQFNDMYGHQTGDRVLVEIAAVITRCVPKDALVAHYGGEEFAIVLPGTERTEAAQVAEAIRKAIDETSVPDAEGRQLHITVSLGVACFEGAAFERAEQLVKAADQGVYAAKAAAQLRSRLYLPAQDAECGVRS